MGLFCSSLYEYAIATLLCDPAMAGERDAGLIGGLDFASFWLCKCARFSEIEEDEDFCVVVAASAIPLYTLD